MTVVLDSNCGGRQTAQIYLYLYNVALTISLYLLYICQKMLVNSDGDTDWGL